MTDTNKKSFNLDELSGYKENYNDVLGWGKMQITASLGK
jgi:hypothetical protein